MTTADPFRVRPLTDAELARLDAEDLLEDERRCLGAAMRENTLLGGPLAGLMPEHFVLPAHRELFAAMQGWHAAGYNFDLDRLNVALAQRKSLQDLGGISYLRQLLDHGRRSLGNVAANAKVLMRKAALGASSNKQPAASDKLEPQAALGSWPPALGQQAPVKLITLAEVEAKPVDWIWEPYLPCGAVAVLSGDPGVGKSYLALAIAARITKAAFGSRPSAVGQEAVTSNKPQVTSENAVASGQEAVASGQWSVASQNSNQQPTAGNQQPSQSSTENRELRTEKAVASESRNQQPTTTNPGQDVLYLSASDSPEQILRPRFDALGGDAKRLHLLEANSRFPLPVARLPQNGDAKANNKRQTSGERETGNGKLTPLLAAALRQTGARLVIVDPLESYLAAEGIGPRSQKFRRLLDDLSSLAQAYNCCVLLVRTLGRSRAERQGTGLLGPADLAGVVRSHLLAGCLSTNPAQRALLHVKSNWGPLAPALGYSINEAEGFCWTGPSDLTWEQMLTPAPAPDPEHKSLLEEAEGFLRVTLAAGPERATTIQKEARELGIAHATLRRAKQRLGVISRKYGAGGWKWGTPVPSGQWSVASEDSNKQQATSNWHETTKWPTENCEPRTENFPATENWEPRTENFEPIEHLEPLCPEAVVSGPTAVASGQWPVKTTTSSEQQAIGMKPRNVQLRTENRELRTEN